MEDKILSDTLAFVSMHLAEEGAFFANVRIGERGEGHWQEFPVVTRPFDFYSQACATSGLIGALRDLGHTTKVEAQDDQRMIRVSMRA